MEILLKGFDIESEIGFAFYVILMLIVFDVLTGIIASAKEKKLSSSISFDGALYKIAELVSIVFVSFIDVYLKADGYILKIGVGLIVIYEVMSVIENFSRIGLDLNFVTKYFDPKKVDTDHKIHKGDDIDDNN